MNDGDARKFQQARTTLKMLSDSSEALCKLSGLISRQVRLGEANVVGIRRRMGLMSLPDEVLAMALQHASEGPS